MKKNHSPSLITRLSFGAALSLSGSLVCADTILGVYAGAGVWGAGYSGDINDESAISTDELGIDSSSSIFAYVALEHPIPLLPNVRLGLTNLQTDATAISNGFEFQGQVFGSGAQTYTDIDLSHIDMTLYYEILDNWVSIDLGLTARVFDGYAQIQAEQEGIDETVDFSGTLPMLYSKARFDLPFSGWYAEGSLNYIGISDSKISDFDAKIGYQTSALVAFDFGIDLGYRSMSVVLDESDDLNADLTISGPYAALTFHF